MLFFFRHNNINELNVFPKIATTPSAWRPRSDPTPAAEQFLFNELASDYDDKVNHNQLLKMRSNLYKNGTWSANPGMISLQ